jgi:hypothetical protein
MVCMDCGEATFVSGYHISSGTNRAATRALGPFFLVRSSTGPRPCAPRSCRDRRIGQARSAHWWDVRSLCQRDDGNDKGRFFGGRRGGSCHVAAASALRAAPMPDGGGPPTRVSRFPAKVPTNSQEFLDAGPFFLMSASPLSPSDRTLQNSAMGFFQCGPHHLATFSAAWPGQPHARLANPLKWLHAP